MTLTGLVVAALVALSCCLTGNHHQASALSSSSSSVSSSSSPRQPLSVLSPNQQELQDLRGPFPRTWVPLASTYELNPDRPTPLTFLGQQYIAYQENSDQWRVMDDACPHRLAPLSEGRVDRTTNAIECAYHGWAFDSAGKCVRVPQAQPSVEAAAIRNPKCHVASYPTVVEKNVLFAWLWSDDPMSIVLSNPAALPENMLLNVPPNSSTYTRDLPYGWDTLLENIVDPAHVPFAHHGMQGKRTDAIAINMTTSTKSMNENGFDFEFSDRTMGLKRSGKGVFRAPYVIQYAAEFEPRPNAKPDDLPLFFNLTTVMVPTKPGWSRAIIFGGPLRQGDNDVIVKLEEETVDTKQKKRKKRKKTLLQLVFSLMPPFALHLFSNRFLDSDLAFLHYQEQERQRRSGGDAQKAYFMPAPADRSVVALRKWLKQYAHVLGPLPPAIKDRSILFDRNAQHTDQCRHCTAALEGMKRWRKNTYRALALCIILANFMAARVGAVACLLMLRLLATLEPSFRVGGFKHYENH